ncbi:MAG: hypothetical protein RLZZ01_1857, partial [Actinomycetota bacterium]
MTSSGQFRTTRRVVAALTVGALVLGACGGDPDVPEDAIGDTPRTVTVYTGRHYGIEAVFAEFTSATGIEVRFTTGSDPELRERLTAEGANTPADVIMTADAAN